MSFTDIKTQNWIQHIPEGLRPYLYLARLDRPIGIWLLALPGWWAIVLASGGLLAMNAQDWAIFVLFGIGALVMRAAGCVINDLWDRDLDKKVERTSVRPLAAGDVSVAQAVIFLAGLLMIGFLILIQMNLITVLLGFLSLPLIVLYPLMKRWTWWPQAFLGLTFNFGALMGWTAIAGIVELPALLLYIGGFFWTLGYDTIYAHQDKEDDALVGIRSTAIRLGDNSKTWINGFYISAFVFMTAAVSMASQGFMPVLLMILPIVFTVKKLKTWNPEEPESCLSSFKSNRDVGLLILLACCF